MLIILVQLLINYFLELISTSLRDKMYVKGPLYQFIALQLFDNFLRIIVIVVACQMDILGVVHAWAFKGLMVWHERNHFGASRCRSLIHVAIHCSCMHCLSFSFQL